MLYYQWHHFPHFENTGSIFLNNIDCDGPPQVTSTSRGPAHIIILAFSIRFVSRGVIIILLYNFFSFYQEKPHINVNIVRKNSPGKTT